MLGKPCLKPGGGAADGNEKVRARELRSDPSLVCASLFGKVVEKRDDRYASGRREEGCVVREQAHRCNGM